MRLHLLRCMRIRSKDLLPESFSEGQPLPADEPVRFVWEKTVKRSPHNAHMKSRVLKELLARRNHYKHVPAKDFDKRTLDATFEQAFSTLRVRFGSCWSGYPTALVFSEPHASQRTNPKCSSSTRAFLYRPTLFNIVPCVRRYAW